MKHSIGEGRVLMPKMAIVLCVGREVLAKRKCEVLLLVPCLLARFKGRGVWGAVIYIH